MSDFRIIAEDNIYSWHELFMELPEFTFALRCDEGPERELEFDMRILKSALMAGVMITTMSAGALVASSVAAAPSNYVVCNRYDECWKVHEKYTRYPADERIIFRDSTWSDAHEHDAHVRWLSDPANDAGYYDRNGDWQPFSDAPPSHP